MISAPAILFVNSVHILKVCREYMHANAHTNTSGICLEEGSTRSTTELGSPPLWLSSFRSTAEVKHHLLVGFGGFLITSEYSVQANHYGGKYYTISSIRGITTWLHVMAINPQCKYCLSVSGVFNLNYESNIFQLGNILLIHATAFI